MTETVFISFGSGTDIDRKGSKVTETWKQFRDRRKERGKEKEGAKRKTNSEKERVSEKERE